MVLVDANILIDVLRPDPAWVGWSEAQLDAAVLGVGACINMMVYTELFPLYDDLPTLDAALPPQLQKVAIPFVAAEPIARAFARYKATGGTRTSPLADFFIGGHAEAAGMTVLTRDPRRFRRYFPGVPLITP